MRVLNNEHDNNCHEGKVKWGLADAFFVLLCLFALMGLTSYFGPSIAGFFKDKAFLGMEPRLTLFFFSALLQSLYLIVLVLIIFRYRGVKISDLGMTVQNFGSNLYIGIGGGLALFFGVIFLGMIMVVLVRTPPPPQEVATYLVAMEGTGPRLLAFLLGSVMAPLSEELYFRGMVYPVVRQRWGRVTGIIVSAVFFSMMHRDLFRFIPIAAGGVGLAYLYDRTGSLWTAIVAHATWNGLMFVIMISASRFMV